MEAQDGPAFNSETIQVFLQTFDENQDGKVTREEWLTFFSDIFD